MAQAVAMSLAGAWVKRPLLFLTVDACSFHGAKYESSGATLMTPLLTALLLGRLLHLAKLVVGDLVIAEAGPDCSLPNTDVTQLCECPHRQVTNSLLMLGQEGQHLFLLIR